MKFQKDRFPEGSNIFKLTAGTLFWWEIPISFHTLLAQKPIWS